MRIAGAGQLGMAYALGTELDRSSEVTLTGYPRRPGDGDLLTNRGQDFRHPLSGGDPSGNRVDEEVGIPPIPDGAFPEVDLILSPGNERYLGSIAAFRAAETDRMEPASGVPPVVWIPTGTIDTSVEAMAVVRDVVALMGWLHRARGARHVRLFTALPFHILPLLAANLTDHVMDQVTFMEYDRAAVEGGASASETYVLLAIRQDPCP